MKNGISKLAFLIFFLSISLSVSAQSSTGASASNYFIISLIIVAAIILIAVIVQVADSLLRIEAKQLGLDESGTNYSLFPKSDEIIRPKAATSLGGSKVIRLKKGHNILLKGAAEKVIDEATQANTFAIQPGNFIGISPIPKVVVEVGDEVKAGEPLFFDKKRPEIQYVAPVSGEVLAVNRGEKRSIAEVVILKDKDIKYREFPYFDLENESRENLVNYLIGSGVWPSIRQRPYDVVADHTITPENIFISCFDTAPLAPDNNFVVQGKEETFQKGLDVLGKLTDGKVYLGLNADPKNPFSQAFVSAKGVEKNAFAGPHPSGNVGVQIHHTAPINAGDKVWTLGVQDVITLGALFTEGRYNAERIVALAGNELESPKYVRTYIGANIGDLLKGNVKGDNVRLISGDVLSGKAKGESSFINFNDDQITVVKEGDYFEMFGWISLFKAKPSKSKAFPSFLYPKEFVADTNTHGEKRAFVITGEYESVLPMDIYPQHLMKSIIINDFERMEGLGIYELSEEDVALCEFVCTSKQPLQKILRQGLDIMREQG